MAALLEARGLSVWWRQRPALREMEFAISTGRIVAIVGNSGSGKTTLLRALLGLLPPEARVGGEIWWRGGPGEARDLLRGSAAARERAWRRLRGRRIALVPQEPQDALDPRRRVMDQMRECLGRAGDIGARLGEVGLDPARGRDYPHQWSGGMLQRLLIAMALARDPALLLADEPTSALDTLHQAQLLDLFARLRQARGLAIVLVTHDLAVAARLADEAVVLAEGRVVEVGRLPETFLQPRATETAALAAAQLRTAAAAGGAV